MLAVRRFEITRKLLCQHSGKFLRAFLVQVLVIQTVVIPVKVLKSRRIIEREHQCAVRQLDVYSISGGCWGRQEQERDALRRQFPKQSRKQFLIDRSAGPGAASLFIPSNFS